MTSTGDHVTITMKNHSCNASRKDYMASNSGFREMYLKNISYSRIDTSYQNYSSTNSSYITCLAAPFASLLSIADPVAGALAGAALSAVIGYEALLNKQTQDLHVLDNNNFVYLNYSAGYRPYDGYMCSRFGEDCYNYYYSLGTNYGPWYAPEFANSYTFPIYFTDFSVSGSDNSLQTDPAIMEMTYSVQMGITLNHIGLFSGPAMNLPFYLAYYSLTYT